MPVIDGSTALREMGLEKEVALKKMPIVTLAL